MDYKSLIYLYAGSASLKYEFKHIISDKSNLIGDFEYQISFKIMEKEIKIWIYNEEVSKRTDEALKEYFKIGEQKPKKSWQLTPTLSSLVLFIPNNTSILRSLEENMETLKDSIMKSGFHAKIAKDLNECIDDEYSEIVFLTPISIRKVFPNSSNYIKLGDLGSGAERAIKIIALTEAINPRLLLIDDFGAGLHPSLIKMMMNWMKEKKWQTIISTHSIDVLYMLADLKPEKTTILQLKKSNEDILDYVTLTIDDLEDILDANNDPRLLVKTFDL